MPFSVPQPWIRPFRCAMHAPHASRVPFVRRRAALRLAIAGPAACGIRRTRPQSRHDDVWEECFQQGGRSAIPCALATCQFVSFLKLRHPERAPISSSLQSGVRLSSVRIKPRGDPRKRGLCVLLQHAIKLEFLQAFDMDALEFHYFGFHRLGRVDPHLCAYALLA